MSVCSTTGCFYSTRCFVGLPRLGRSVLNRGMVAPPENSKFPWRIGWIGLKKGSKWTFVAKERLDWTFVVAVALCGVGRGGRPSAVG